MRVRLHIDRLVIRGAGALDRSALAASLQREFTRRFSVPGSAQRLTGPDAATRFAGDAIRAAISKGGLP